MSNTYRFPERGHVYQHCVLCGRPKFAIIRNTLREKLKIKVMQQLLLKAGAFVVTASMVFGQQEQTNAPGDGQFSPLQLAERTMHRRAVEAPS